jgi:hypothetical protein
VYTFTEKDYGLNGHAPVALYSRPMSEIIFLVEETSDGGYTAKALGSPIFTEADSVDELHANVRDAVQCHFDEGNVPQVIRLHFVRDEVIALYSWPTTRHGCRNTGQSVCTNWLRGNSPNRQPHSVNH